MIKKFTLKFKFVCLLGILFFNTGIKAQFIVSDTAGAWTLVNTLIGTGISVSNAALVCPTVSKGTYSGSTTLGIGKGIVLTSGLVSGFPGIDPGIDTLADYFSNVDADGDPTVTLFDAQLDSLIAPFTTFNSCALEFDFVPIDSFFSFKYVFASEEYPEFACTEFNDVFAFFINGPGYAGYTNLALIPGTNIPVTINSINEDNPMVDTFPNFNDRLNCTSMGAGSPFSAFYRDNSTGFELVYDALTTVLTASGKVWPCRTYHMKIAIADAGDEFYDSGVFLEENSFSSGASIHAQSNRDTTSNRITEACETGKIVLRTPAVRSSSQILNLAYAGNAISGTDYLPLPSSVTIPAFRDTATLNITSIADGIFEPNDTIKVYVINPCTLLPYDSTILIISDLRIDTVHHTLCTGGSLFLGGATRTTTGAWRDTVTSIHGCDSVFVSRIDAIIPAFNTNINQSICTGDSFFFNGVWIRTAAIYHDTLITSASCDSFIHLTLTIRPNLTSTATRNICMGDYILVNGTSVNTAGTYYDSLSSSTGCDSIVTITLIVHALDSTNINRAICNGDSIRVNGRNVGSAGIYFDTLTNRFSCDSIIHINLSIKPISSFIRALSMCAEDSLLLGGRYRHVAGTYYDTLVNYVGCDSVLQSNLSIYIVLSDTISTSICEGDSLLLNGIYRSVTGYYRDTFNNVNGCDSIAFTHLLIKPVSRDTLLLNVCDNDSVLVSGSWIDTAGFFTDTLTSIIGCDSFHITQVKIIPTTFSRTLKICIGDSALLGGVYVDTAGLYYDSLVSTTTGCDSILTTNLVINPNLTITFISADTSLCLGKSSVLQVNSTGSTYLWSNGLTTSTISITPASNRTYTVTVSDSNGCKTVDSVMVQVKPLPNISLANLFDICLGQSVHITLNPGYNYLWSDRSTDNDRTFTPNINHTSYTITVTDSVACEKIYSTQIELHLSDIVISAAPGDTIDLGTALTLHATSFDAIDSIITWTPNGIAIDSHAHTITFIPNQSGYYSVYSISPYGCEFRDSIFIYILNPDTIAVPTAFSPNGDGVNDLFRPFLSSYLQLVSFRVYDRWGILVFDSSADLGPLRGWDGTYKGRAQPISSFVYYIEASNLITGKQIRKSGNVTLLR